MATSKDAIYKARLSGLLAGLITPLLTLLTGLILSSLCVPLTLLGCVIALFTGLAGALVGLCVGGLEGMLAGGVMGLLTPPAIGISLGAAFGTSILAAFALARLAINRAYTGAFRKGEVHFGVADWWRGLKFSCQLVAARIKAWVKNDSKDLDALISPRERANAPLSYKIINAILSLPWIAGVTLGGGALGAAIGHAWGGLGGFIAGGVVSTSLVATSGTMASAAIQKANTEKYKSHLTKWEYKSAQRETLKRALELSKIRLNDHTNEFKNLPLSSTSIKYLKELVDRAGLDLCHKSSSSSYNKAKHISNYVNKLLDTKDGNVEGEADFIKEISKRRKHGIKFFEDRGSPAIMQDLQKEFTHRGRKIS